LLYLAASAPLAYSMENAMRLFAISALVAGLAASPAALSADKAKATRHLTADQAVSCIKMASAARAGNITKIEIDVDDGRTICEVHMEDAKGKNYEAHVDVAANKVLRVKD
jgi:uncharacterized membrane protein YkoI